MNLRQYNSGRNRPVATSPEVIVDRTKTGYIIFFVSLIMLVCLITVLRGTSHASAEGNIIKSGWSGYCLDVYKNHTNLPENRVDIWPCNNTQAQDWELNMTQIKHEGDYCLQAESAKQVDLVKCSDDASQVWLRNNTGYLNPSLGLCLSAASAGQGQSLQMSSCNKLTNESQSWVSSLNYLTYKCSGTQAQIVACNAAKEWNNWVSNPNDHVAYLNKYTGSASYEEWCADFISYIYKESGYPFHNGNYNGWDENIADQIQNQGFTYHLAAGYTPKAGDVAYFNYNGGHVEIVVSGGSKPTFIYGNSSTIDPSTGNGQMATNTITIDGALGQVIYYLSPNSST